MLPVCVVGVAGTTNTGSIDDLPALADFCEREGLWFHVDGAFGAWAAIAPESRHLVAGMERADSLAFDLHKWMNLTYPVGCVLVRDAEAQRRTFSLTPSYLAHGEGERGLTGVDVPWLSDYGFELSRGFHALKAWMALKEHGADKFGRVIQQNIDQARYLAGLVAAAPELEQALPVALNIVCFRYVRPGLDDAALDQLNKEHRARAAGARHRRAVGLDHRRAQVPARGGRQPPQPPRGLRPAGARGRAAGRGAHAQVVSRSLQDML